MAYNDTFSFRLLYLLTKPKKGIKKIIPFIKSRLEPWRRSIFEAIGIFTLSKPYCGHDDLLKYISVRDGFFVQCGGNEGYSNDPTYYLEKYLGWKGLIAEPLPIYKLCQQNRKASVVYNCAIGSFAEKEKTVSFVDCNAMSFVEGSIENPKDWIAAGEKTQNIEARRITVPIRPIQSLIDDYQVSHPVRKIDFLVGDVEGYELAVIQGLDFKKNSPTWILLEIREDERKKIIEKYLTERNYAYIATIGHNDHLFKIKHKHEEKR